MQTKCKWPRLVTRKWRNCCVLSSQVIGSQMDFSHALISRTLITSNRTLRMLSSLVPHHLSSVLISRSFYQPLRSICLPSSPSRNVILLSGDELRRLRLLRLRLLGVPERRRLRRDRERAGDSSLTTTPLPVPSSSSSTSSFS